MPSWNSRMRRHGGLKAIERKRFEQTRLLVNAAAVIGRTEDKEGKEVVEACVEFLRDNPLRVLNQPTEDFLEQRMEEADKRTPIAQPEADSVGTTANYVDVAIEGPPPNGFELHHCERDDHELVILPPTPADTEESAT